MMRAFKILAAILILGLVALVALGYSLNDPRPEGQPGPDADPGPASRGAGGTPGPGLAAAGVWS